MEGVGSLVLDSIVVGRATMRYRYAVAAALLSSSSSRATHHTETNTNERHCSSNIAFIQSPAYLGVTSYIIRIGCHLSYIGAVVLLISLGWDTAKGIIS